MTWALETVRCIDFSQQLAEQGEQAFPGSGHQTAQEEEIRHLKRELEVTRQERDILKKWSASSPRKSDEVCVYFPVSAGVRGEPDVPSLGGLSERLLCLETAREQSAATRG